MFSHNANYSNASGIWPDSYRIAIDGIREFSRHYEYFHLPLVICIGIFGTVANFLNVIVLTRQKNMTPTNLILSSLAVCQGGLLISYTSYTVAKSLAGPLCGPHRSFSLMVFLLVCMNANLLFHNIAVGHVISLSILRYFVLQKNQPHEMVVSTFMLKRCLAAVYALSGLLCIPLYLNSEIVPISPNSTDFRSTCGAPPDLQQRTFGIQFSRLSLNSGLFKFNFWMFGIFCKLVPCVLVGTLSVLLAVKLHTLQRNRNRLQGAKLTTDLTNVEGSTLAEQKHIVASSCSSGSKLRSKTYDTVAKVILLVMGIFVIVELPQGIFNLLAGILGPSFTRRIYSPLVDFSDMLTVLYSSVNFILYCIMSESFRFAFKRMLTCTYWRICCLETYSRYLPSTTSNYSLRLRQGSLLDPEFTFPMAAISSTSKLSNPPSLRSLTIKASASTDSNLSRQPSKFHFVNGNIGQNANL